MKITKQDEQNNELFPNDSDSFFFSPSSDNVEGDIKTLKSLSGISSFGHVFNFVELGGTNRLKPGGLLEQTIDVPRPPGSGFMVALNGFSGAFITDGGARLTQRPLGQFYVFAWIRGENTLVCRVRLTDENADDPIQILVRVGVLFF